MKENNAKTSLITDLEETALRLHVWLRREENSHEGFKRLREKLEKKRPVVLGRQDKAELSAYQLYKFYHGKLYAYMYVLGRISRIEKPERVVDIIERLRGMEWDNKKQTKIVETRPFYWGYHPKK